MWCRRRQNPNESEHLEPLHHISTIATYGIRFFRSRFGVVDGVDDSRIGKHKDLPEQLGHPLLR